MRSLVEEIEAEERHRKWVDWQQHRGMKGKKEGDAPDPCPPAYYKDCKNCPVSKDRVEVRERECMPCTYEAAQTEESLVDGKLPASPSPLYIKLQLLARLPEAVIADLSRDRLLTFQELQGVALLRNRMTGGIR